MSTTVHVYQIYFRPEQQAHLETVFVPYDNSKSAKPEQMEYGVFHDSHRRGVVTRADYTGFVSWKFRQKTGISGEAFVDFIRANPGHDVYFINPFPSELIWKNVWAHGDEFHPGILRFAQRIFDRVGYPIRLAELENLPDTAAYCNFWVGSPQFWEAYMAFTQPVYHYLLHELPVDERAFLWSRADRRISASYFPFMFERMFSTLLATDSSIDALGYRYPEPALRARYRPQIVELILASYELADQDYQVAGARLLRSVRELHIAERARRNRRSLLERVFQQALERAASVLRR